MNLWPNGAAVDPTKTDASPFSCIRFAAGQITIFDQNNNPLPISAPDSTISSNWPLTLLGTNPGASIISSLVVPNIQSQATALKATLTLQSSPQAAALAVTNSTGATANWTYVPSGSVWVAQQFTIPVASTNVSGTRTTQFANLNWNDNATNDAARATKALTVAAPPVKSSAQPASLTAVPADLAAQPSASTIVNSDCNTHVYNLGGSQNIVLTHGIFSSSCSWTRMANWLNQDFKIGTEIVPSLSSTSAISSQGNSLVNEINSVGGNGYVLLGHSQGGLVSRYAAQHYQIASPMTVRGVGSVDTPHLGANRTLNSPVVIGALLEAWAFDLYGTLGCFSAYDNFGCYAAAVMFAGGAALEPLLQAQVGSTSWSDLQPGSAFLTSLNAGKETFGQGAVVGLTD